MDKSLALLVLGLIMVGLGLLALIIDPPRTHIYSESELIPYTTFKKVPPGWHNETVYYTVGKGVLRINLPGRNATTISVGLLNTKNCTVVATVLNLYGEGYFKAEDGRYISITLLVEQGNETDLLDEVNIVIKASSLAVTPLQYTVTVRPGESLPKPPHTLSTSYTVKSRKGLLQAIVYKPSREYVAVKIGPSSSHIPIPLKADALIVKAGGDAHGKLYLYAYVQKKCIMTYYIDRPLYVPYTSFKRISIRYSYLELGSVATSAILVCVGITTMMLSCYLEIRNHSYE